MATGRLIVLFSFGAFSTFVERPTSAIVLAMVNSFICVSVVGLLEEGRTQLENLAQGCRCHGDGANCGTRPQNCGTRPERIF